MAVYLAPTFGAGYQAFDTNGLPLNGGFISTFAAGTATPLSTWTTSTGLVANPTSLQLGTDGRPPSEIWLTGATTYLFQVFTSSGVSIKSYDNLQGINDPAFAGNSVAALWAVAGGTSDVITATYTPANTSLTDGLILGFRASAPNQTTTPTFSPDALTAHTITRKGGSPVAIGDIPGGLAECLVRYNLANTRWELLNPFVPQLIRSYLAGYTLSCATSATSTMSTAAGSCVDTNNSVLMNLSSATFKTMTAWAAGPGSGGLDTGATSASSTYHFYAIERPDTQNVDVIFSTSAVSPTLPANYTVSRRYGSARTTSSGVWMPFVQDGDYFRLNASVRDVNTTNPGIAAVTLTLGTMPTAINVQSMFNIIYDSDGVAVSNHAYYVSDLAANDEAPSQTAAPLASYSMSVGGAAAQEAIGGFMTVRTNTSGQVRFRAASSAAGFVLVVASLGWLDTRGRNA